MEVVVVFVVGWDDGGGGRRRRRRGGGGGAKVRHGVFLFFARDETYGCCGESGMCDVERGVERHAVGDDADEIVGTGSGVHEETGVDFLDHIGAVLKEEDVGLGMGGGVKRG